MPSLAGSLRGQAREKGKTSEKSSDDQPADPRMDNHCRRVWVAKGETAPG
jgi:hypothetical protein